MIGSRAKKVFVVARLTAIKVMCRTFMRHNITVRDGHNVCHALRSNKNNKIKK